jgi:hypothetical protein
MASKTGVTPALTDNGGDGPDVPPVTTPDMKQRAQLTASGIKSSGVAEYFWAAFWAALVDGIKAIITLLAGAFDEVLSLIVPFLTASQGEKTDGFYDLVAGLLNDLLGVDVAGGDLSDAQSERGRIGAMQQVGGDFFQALANEFIGNQPDAGAGAGTGGLPGVPGVPLTPTQGVAAAKAFIGFLLSFSVRQGNVAVLSDALSFHLLTQLREYGEMMAKNLGLSRMARRALQPFVQTLIAGPLQQALNQQYRPHVMDEKQIASAYIRGELDHSDFMARLALQGFTDADAALLISDTYTRLPLDDVLILQDNGIISDSDAQSRITALGFNTSDVPLLRQAKAFTEVAGVQRAFIKGAITDLQSGAIDTPTFEADVDRTNLPTIEKQWYKILGENRAHGKRKQLSLGFLKKVYLDGTITIDELLSHVALLGYSQDDADIIEVEVLTEQAAEKKKAAAKAAALAAKVAAKNTPSTPTGD